ncbi:DUF4012 domain-containing protein [Candidatus Falkowbacteria bacterium]|nr:DUF4012 domain-containing protein [Candidatus Falkowbacteria bacterium]
MEHDQSQQNNLPDFSKIRELHARSKNMQLLSFFKWLSVAFGVLFALLMIFIFAYMPTFNVIIDEGKGAKALLEQASAQVVNRDFYEGAVYVQQAHEKLRVVRDKFDSIILIRYIPIVSSQVKAVDALLDSGVDMSAAGVPLLSLADDITKDIKNESIPFSDITPEQQKIRLQKVINAKPAFEQLKNAIASADDAFTRLDAKRLVAPLDNVVATAQTYLPTVRTLADQAVPLIDVLPKVVGFEETKTYLFLLQNNHELRPTGGFIGTYGILKLKDGAIQTLITDNIYNLDRAFDDKEEYLTPQQTLNRPTPAPLQKYLEQKQWSLRDINWDPDFPTTAQTAIEMYNLESVAARDIERQIFNADRKNRGKEFVSRYLAEDFDGVFAMTPQVIESLLKITGPVVVDGIRFTDENFQEELSFRVTYEYRDLIIEERNRKDIIRRIAEQIKARILSLPYTRLVDVAQTMLDSLLAKSILVYSNDDTLQSMISQRGWSGEISNDSLDYIFVVDSNLGSLKTDQFMQRHTDYKIREDGGKYIAQVSLTYEHTGEFAWNSTRLRSYTRVYVPQGARLLSSTGEMFDDSTKNPENKQGVVDVYDEHGKTVFGAFIAVEPKSKHTLVFEYELPGFIGESIKKGSYNLLIQKQPGVTRDLTVALDFDKTIRKTSPYHETVKDVYTHTQKMIADTWIVLGF